MCESEENRSDQLKVVKRTSLIRIEVGVNLFSVEIGKSALDSYMRVTCEAQLALPSVSGKSSCDYSQSDAFLPSASPAWYYGFHRENGGKAE
jgi:hypothetical protein